MAIDRMAWLRDLLEDNPTTEIEAVTGNGSDREFTVSNPPILVGTLQVTLEGSPQTAGTHYLQPDVQSVLFATPPPDDSHVVFIYTRQLFQVAELERYLEAAGQDYTKDTLVVYRAAIYAVDTLLVGSATALRFGAGAEDFDMPSVYERLKNLRDNWWESYGEFTATEGEGAVDGEPVLGFADIEIPMEDPIWPGNWSNDPYVYPLEYLP